MKSRCKIIFGIALVALMLGSSGCDMLHMYHQARYMPYEKSEFYADQRTARLPIPNTVARGQLHDDELLYTGKVNGVPVDMLPFPLTREGLERGRERFNINCSPCHGQTGLGNGMVVQRGFSAPPSYMSPDIAAKPIGHYFDVMTSGFGAMPDYKAQVSVHDRWLIAAYIRALQLSHHVRVADVPADIQAKLQEEK